MKILPTAQTSFKGDARKGNLSCIGYLECNGKVVWKGQEFFGQDSGIKAYAEAKAALAAY